MMNKKIYERYKKNVENDLRNYPYWLLAIETPGLGSPNRWGTNKAEWIFSYKHCRRRYVKGYGKELEG